jgi:hypothetical protein
MSAITWQFRFPKSSQLKLTHLDIIFLTPRNERFARRFCRQLLAIDRLPYRTQVIPGVNRDLPETGTAS